MRFIKDLIYLWFYTRRLLVKPFLCIKEVTVLLYHSIAEDDWYASVWPEIFEKQMRFLKKYFQVVPLDDIVKYQRGEIDLPDKSVAITFDDGYLDNYKMAWPILKKYDFPFTIFVTTDLGQLKDLNNQYSRLNWSQIKEMSGAGVDIGGHGVSHRDLNKLSLDEAKSEIEDCFRTLEQQLGREPKNFSYPGGKFNSAVKQLVKEVGWQSACSTQEGLVRKKADPFQIKRVGVHRDLSLMSFMIRLTIVTDWVNFIKMKKY